MGEASGREELPSVLVTRAVSSAGDVGGNAYASSMRKGQKRSDWICAVRVEFEGTPQVRRDEPLDAKDGLVWCALIRDKSLTMTIDHQIKPLKHGHAQ